jgi:predicted nucleic acid-binding protein
MDNSNKLYVVDTSVTAKLFLVEEQSEEAKRIYQQAARQEIMLLAPELICYELISVLSQEDIALSTVKEHLFLFEELVKNETLIIVPYSFTILNKASEIASLDTGGQGYISSFDATFHALAVLMKAVFITADEKHYNKTKDLIGSVMLLENFYSSG